MILLALLYGFFAGYCFLCYAELAWWKRLLMATVWPAVSLYLLGLLLYAGYSVLFTDEYKDK